jgi:hypothetical protein
MVLWVSGEVATIAIKNNVVTSLMVADNKKHPTAGVVGVGVVENFYSSSIDSSSKKSNSLNSDTPKMLNFLILSPIIFITKKSYLFSINLLFH